MLESVGFHTENKNFLINFASYLLLIHLKFCHGNVGSKVIKFKRVLTVYDVMLYSSGCIWLSTRLAVHQTIWPR